MPFPLIPAIISGLGSLGSFFSKRPDLAVAGLSGISGLLSGRESARTQQQSGSQSFTRTPIIPTELQGVRQRVISSAEDLLDQDIGIDPSLLNRLEQGEIVRANERGRNVTDAVQQALAERGLSFSPGPVATATALGEESRSRDISRIGSTFARERLNLPFLIDQLRRGRLETAAGILRGDPGIGVSGETTSEGTSVGAGSPLAQGFSNVSQVIATELGRRARQRELENLFGNVTRRSSVLDRINFD